MPSNEEINKHLHEKVMGKCWHDYELPVGREDKCGLCGHVPVPFNGPQALDKPDYTSSKSPRYLLEDAVAKACVMTQSTKWYQALEGESVLKKEGKDYWLMTEYRPVTAEQISTAIFYATGGETL